LAELLRDSGARIAVVSTRAMYDKVHAVRSETPLEHIVMMDVLNVPPDAVMFSMLTQALEGQALERDAEFDALVESAQPEELATLIYTSGRRASPRA
jgi:long-chain acyl-CoA synthetase